MHGSLLAHLRVGHGVQRLDRHGRIAGPELDEHQPPAGLELERGEQKLRPLLLDALGALQPFRAVEAHDLRNLAAQIDFPDTISARRNGGVATRRGFSCRRRQGERKYQKKKQGGLRIHFPSPGSRTTMPLAKISTATAASSNPMIRITTLMPIFPSRRPIWVAALSAIQVVR